MNTIGIDIGGTNTVVAIADESGLLPGRVTFSTRDYPEFPRYVEKLADVIASLREEAGLKAADIPGIGIGAPCADPSSGCIINPSDLPWKGVLDIGGQLSQLTGIPVRLANDANMAARGEGVYGNARGCDNYIVITLGTGVGAGVVCNGILLDGAHGYAGELGHIIIDPEGRQCSCGRRGCLQMYCNARGMVANMKEVLSQTSLPSSLRFRDFSAKDVGTSADGGDEGAIEALRLTGEYLGLACANFAAFTDPERIILFGGVANAGRPLLDSVDASFRRYALFLNKDVTFHLSALPAADAALLGAAASAIPL